MNKNTYTKPIKDSTRRNLFFLTINKNPVADLVSPDQLSGFFKNFCKRFVFQIENAGAEDWSIEDSAKRDENRDHYQIYISTIPKMSKNTLLKKFDNQPELFPEGRLRVHVEAVENKERAIEYCSKEETRLFGPFCFPSNMLTQYTYMGEDLQEFYNSPRIWQKWILDMLCHKPDDRRILCIYNKEGRIGKSKLVKGVCWDEKYNALRLPFGTHQQMREILTGALAKNVYFIDLPKTMGKGEDLPTMISVIEDLKNGFVQSVMRGNLGELYMTPPWIIVFTNHLPDPGFFSPDRWKVVSIDDPDQDKFEFLSVDQHWTLWRELHPPKRKVSSQKDKILLELLTTLVKDKGIESSSAIPKRGRGRPKGSKTKTKEPYSS